MNTIHELRQAVLRVGSRYRRVHVYYVLAALWFIMTAGTWTLLRIDSVIPSQWLIVALLTIVMVLGVWLMIVRRTSENLHWLARHIEAKYPDLSAVLLTAVEQQSAGCARLNYLQVAVVETAIAHRRSHDWDETVSSQKLQLARWAHRLAFGLMILTVVFGSVKRFVPLTDDAERPQVLSDMATTIRVEVEPGNTEIERGQALLVTAKFFDVVPSDASLVIDGMPPYPMSRQLDDPVFAAQSAAILTDASYRVEYSGGQSLSYQVKVFDHPEITRMNARIAYPALTGQSPQTVSDVRHVTVVEGSVVTLECHLNKPVTAISCESRTGEVVALSPVPSNSTVYTITWTATESQRYKFRLLDDSQRSNKRSAEFALNVVRNRPPLVKVTSPGRDSRVSPLEELNLLADMKDDYGLIRYGITVIPAHHQAQEVTLGGNEPQPKTAQARYLLDFESLGAQPDQVVSYYFWAEDLDSRGQPRRTSSDLFFAEVRHFEEIFRQGDPQPRNRDQERQSELSGMQNPAQQVEQLSELQKELINATWTVIRREITTPPSQQFDTDRQTLRESQQSIRDKASELKEKLMAPDSLNALERAMNFMSDVEQHLQNATPGTLPSALALEQAAYQELLKLRAREFDVTRSNRRDRSQRSQANTSRNPSQRQLQQLDLTEDDQRYETQDSARTQQERQAQRDQAQRENQLMIERLKELARRQLDLTERVKELQFALEQEKEESNKDELRQQLKRLRDQQEEVLRDTDELQERMEQEQNRERLAESRQLAQEARENARQAAEALNQERLADAVNSGTRAGRQLDELRDQLRKQSANQFSEDMRELRRQARQLDEEQQALTKALDDIRRDSRPGLRNNATTTDIESRLEEQKKQLDTITQRIQQTIMEAEHAAPTLAQELYESARKSSDERIGEKIDATKRLAEAGLIPEAVESSRKAGQGMEQLRQDIEKAANNVLGGQTEELKRAQRELEDLTERLEQEIAQATGQRSPNRSEDRMRDQQTDTPSSSRDPSRTRSESGQQPMNPSDSERASSSTPDSPMLPGPQQGRSMDDSRQEGQEPGQSRRLNRLTEEPARNSDFDRPTGPAYDRAGGGERRFRAEPTREGPIREGGFREWNERMRATEELLDDPQLRAEAARIRDRVRATREEYKRHAKEPDWNLLRDNVMKPLNELRQRISEEVRKRESPDALVPIDRDPVPPRFVDDVRKYYERLGSER